MTPGPTPAQFVALDQGGPGEAVPLHDVAAADAAGLDLDQDLAGTGRWGGDLLDPDVPVVVPHGYSHYRLLGVRRTA